MRKLFITHFTFLLIITISLVAQASLEVIAAIE